MIELACLHQERLLPRICLQGKQQQNITLDLISERPPKTMKSMGNDDNGSNSNWLGFSLSSHIKMEAPQTQQPPTSAVTPAVPLGFFNSQPHLNYGHGLYYGAAEAHNASGFYPHFPVMPLKSDGSLCLMEALNRTTQQPQQAMFSSSTPKLEDFFGGSTMGAHDYGSSEREAMALSLDSMYYHHQQQNTESAQNSHNCLTQLQHNNSRQINHQVVPPQQLQYYSGIKNYELLLAEEAKESNSNHLQKMISCIGDNGGEAAGGGSVGAMGYGDLQCLSLSMSPGSQSSCVTGSHQISPAGHDCSAMETKKRGAEKVDQKQIVHRKSIDTFGQRTSQYRGVTRHRWTGRYEAHLWDNSCKKEGQSRKGRQVYLGGYDMEEKAARAYDLAALKYWGPSTHINFPLENYQNELEEMKNMTRQEYVAHLRRKSSGFSRGASIYRGVTRHHQHGRWQARIGRVAGNKDLYLGTFSTQEEAAEAYDIAAIKFRGVNAVTNFDISRYDVERIMASNTLLAGELARRDKEICPNENISAGETVISPKNNVTGTEADWKMVLYQSSQQLEHRQGNAVDNYKNQSFSLAPENVVGIGAMSSVHEAVEGSNKMEAHMSNASSLVTSLSSSREGSPDKNSLSMLFAVPAAGTNKLIASPASNVNTWNIPSAQLRPALTIPQMPVFAAWTDA